MEGDKGAEASSLGAMSDSGMGWGAVQVGYREMFWKGRELSPQVSPSSMVMLSATAPEPR